MSTTNTLQRLLELKCRLPLNGDWLFVTETPYCAEENADSSQQKYDQPSSVLSTIRSTDIDVIKLIYERARAHESDVYETANHVYDKAKTLLSTGSVVTAILLGVVSFLLTDVTRFAGWLIAAELLLFILVTGHLIRSLYIAIDVMTREESVRASPVELLSPRSIGKTAAISSYKQAISQMLAYSNQTRELVRKRVNKVILGQHAFKIGLVCFVFFVLVHLAGTMWLGRTTFDDPISKLKALDARLALITSKEDEHTSAITALTREVALLREATDSAVEESKQTRKGLAIEGKAKEKARAK